MAKPSEKHPEVNEALDVIAKNRFGKSRTDSITEDTCVFCHQPAVTFKDELSKKEFSISGICQKCQDETFSE